MEKSGKNRHETNPNKLKVAKRGKNYFCKGENNGWGSVL